MNQRLLRAFHVLLVLALLGAVTGQERPATLADALHDTPEASMLTELFEEAGLIDEFAGPVRLTFFAPSNTALERLDPEVLEMMRRDRGVLDVIVRHHTVMGASPLSSLRRLDALTTLEGTHLLVRTDAFGVRVEGVRIENAGIATDNGVLYLVDRVLIPQGGWAIKDLLAGPQAP